MGAAPRPCSIVLVSETPEDELRIVDAPDRQRYEAVLDGRVVGYSEYRQVRGDRLILFHTEVDPAISGRGIGSHLAAGALDDAIARGLRVTVKCPFISAWLRRHPTYEARLGG